MHVQFVFNSSLLKVPDLINYSIRTCLSTVVVTISLYVLCNPILYSQNQDIYFKHYNFQNGLSGPVKKLVQDHTGFI